MLTYANNMEDFSNWLILEMDRQRMTQADLARSSKLSTSTISMILSGSRSIGKEAAISIANALKIAPETVYRAAGLLPPKPKDQADVDDLVYKYGLLDTEQKAQALDFIDFLLERGEPAPVIDFVREPEKMEPPSEEEIIRSIRLLALRYGYTVEDLDLAAMIRNARRVSEKQSGQDRR